LQKVSLKQYTLNKLDDFRHRLAYIDALPQLTFLGFIIGLTVGLVITLFRVMINWPLAQLLPIHGENFEALSREWHFLLPVIGAIIIGVSMQLLPAKYREVSVGHVLTRLHNFQGRMPGANFIVQFIGATISLITGQSVGREGPAVHLGASAASIVGQWMNLPNNSLRTLIGCGVAAAIAASFNTPVAGVIFALEVLLIEYTIAGFIPIIMASVCGSVVTRIFFGEELFFSIPVMQMQGLLEIPFMVFGGLVIALFATLYMRLQFTFNYLQKYPISLRIIAAGIATGSIALFYPQILGLGYDTLNQVIDGQLSLNLLLMIAGAKLLATSFSISMGVPGGLIGPQLLIGACIGGALGIVGNTLFPDSTSNTGFYVLLGMAAMMGAVLNAPLAALMAVLEMTYTPGVIFPSMLIIVIACVITRQLFRCDGIFLEQLKKNGTSLTSGPAHQTLSRIGVRSVMDTSFVRCRYTVAYDQAHTLLTHKPMWIVIEEIDKEKYLLRAADFAKYLDNAPEEVLTLEQDIDLLEIPAQRYKLAPVSEQASLFEAKRQLDYDNSDALYVARQPSNPVTSAVMGIITHNTIENCYQI